jgi:hypothetical protein
MVNKTNGRLPVTLHPRAMSAVVRRALVLAIASMLAACTTHDPPTPSGSPSVATAEALAPSPSASGTTVSPAPSGAASSTRTVARAAPSASASASPAVDPSTLPQTHDRPEASGAAFDARVAALWDAIVADDPARALPCFFPLGAYRQVKDVPDPASDWNRRLVAAYSRDIHALHGRLGDGAARARLVGLDIPRDRGRWVDPGEEYNKIGYFRVFGSRLRYEVDGNPHAFEVKSLISWRGEWYVVHLSAIQ